MSEHGLCGLPRPGRRIPNLIKVDTLEDLVNRQFSATWPNELWCTDIERREALFNRTGVRDLRRRAIAGARQKLGAA